MRECKIFYSCHRSEALAIYGVEFQILRISMALCAKNEVMANLDEDHMYFQE
jgi:hypothetical protein